MSQKKNSNHLQNKIDLRNISRVMGLESIVVSKREFVYLGNIISGR